MANATRAVRIVTEIKNECEALLASFGKLTRRCSDAPFVKTKSKDDNYLLFIMPSSL